LPLDAGHEVLPTVEFEGRTDGEGKMRRDEFFKKKV
jgi:hypothetical protein